jgi:hypothetical protein
MGYLMLTFAIEERDAERLISTGGERRRVTSGWMGT